MNVFEIMGFGPDDFNNFFHRINYNIKIKVISPKVRVKNIGGQEVLDFEDRGLNDRYVPKFNRLMM